MDWTATANNTLNTITVVGWKILAAIALYVVGRWLIGLAVRLVQRAMTAQKIEPTLLRYAGSIISVTLNVALVIAILGYFGVETTSFAALLAGAGLAIGAAWSGLLSNFASGAFLVILRPYKVGDFVTAAGVTGTVSEIGLFSTVINTPDNVITYVGNGKVLGDTIQNFSSNEYRRVDLLAQLHHSVDPAAAIQLLKSGLGKIPNVVSNPAPDVEILQFNLAGPVLAVRPYCNNAHYWQVYFDTNRLIREEFGNAGVPAPEQNISVKQSA